MSWVLDAIGLIKIYPISETGHQAIIYRQTHWENRCSDGIL